MVDSVRVRELALALPEAADGSEGERLAFTIAGKGFAWSYLQRVTNRPRALRADVLAIRCPLERKEMLIEAAPETFFDDDHYRGFPAVLARLNQIEEAELAAMLAEAWRIQAPKRLLKG
jgi:hypothetical protein